MNFLKQKNEPEHQANLTNKSLTYASKGKN